jgi:hypothetical protein
MPPVAEVPELEEEALLEEARQSTGLSDFGDDEFREGLRALIATYRDNPFTERGRKRNHRRLVGLLSTRLRMEAAWSQHPEILERPVRRPVVLTGLPRSGTSALFNLLGEDPAARPLRLWETQFPDPLPDFSPERRGEADPRRDAIEAHYARSREKNPEFTKIHYTSADTPEECVLVHAYAFHGVHLGIEPMMEPYRSWYPAQDLGGMYAYQKKILQLLDWQRPGERWLLKAPAHMWGIDALTTVFPDVAIVWSHRSPLRVVASISSMTHALMVGREDLDKTELGPVVMDFYATSLERGLAARDRLDPALFVDVAHDGFVADPMGAVRRIYDHFGLPLSDEARAAMKGRVASHPKGEHGSHDYGLEEYGLDVDTVKARFTPYVERFEVDWE